MQNPDSGSHLRWGPGPALFLSVVAAAVALLALHVRNSFQPLWYLDTPILAEYIFIYFSALAVTAFYRGYRHRLGLARWLGSRWLVLPCAALLGCLSYRLGLHQFGASDEDMMVHVMANYAAGLRPYRDFLCTMPPLLMAGLRAAMLTVGLRWQAISALTAVATATSTVWLFVLLRRNDVERHWALAVSVAIELSTMVAIPFWWYNNTAALAAVALLMAGAACLRRPGEMASWLHVWLAAALVMTAKPNVFPQMLIVPVLFTMRDRSWRLQALKTVAVGVALFFAVCTLAQTPPRLIAGSYAEVGRLRGNPLEMLGYSPADWPHGAMIGVLAACSLFGLGLSLLRSAAREPAEWRLRVLCGVSGLTSMEMLFTNSEVKCNDLALALAACALLCLVPRTQQAPATALSVGTATESEAPPGTAARLMMAALLALFVCFSGFFSAMDRRILAIGERRYYELLPTETLHDGFFAGMKAAPRFRRVLEQSAAAVAEFKPRKVFFGPWLGFAYATLRLQPIPNMPVTWGTGVRNGAVFSPERMPNLLLSLQEQDPDLLVFLKDDVTGMGPVGFYFQHSAAYERIDRYSELAIYRRRPEVPIHRVAVSLGTPVR